MALKFKWCLGFEGIFHQVEGRILNTVISLVNLEPLVNVPVLTFSYLGQNIKGDVVSLEAIVAVAQLLTLSWQDLILWQILMNMVNLAPTVMWGLADT